MVRTVAVIGAGASGLAAVKCCLDEGLEPTCFERNSHICGLWHYTEKVKEGHVTVMKNTIANASKEVTAFSDFPPPPEHPIYWHNRDFENYLQLYADNFNLKKHIRLNTEVVRIYGTDDHAVTGRWNVKVKDVLTGNTELSTFDAVLVCSGVFSKPIVPNFPGLDTFKGRVIHTCQYKNSAGFENMRVVVVGVGNSAGDVAVDVSDVANQVYLSTRNGGWLLSRLEKGGQPLDMALLSRFPFSFLTLFPSLLNKAMAKKCNESIDHYVYGINPKQPPSRSNAMINDVLPYKLLLGEVKMKPEIKQFTNTDVEFVDGTRLENIDVVILATGYHPEFLFIDDDIIGDDVTRHYLGMFPPERPTQTLATIGFIRIKGPLVPIIEMQCRLATRVFKGIVKLPDSVSMKRSTDYYNRESRERKYNFPGVIGIDYFSYMDKVASIIGCKPSFWKLLLTDRKLAKEYLFGPINAYQYRLMGPGSWSGAKDAIINQWQRTYYSINQGKMPQRRKKSTFTKFMWIATFGLFCAAVYMYNYKVSDIKIPF